MKLTGRRYDIAAGRSGLPLHKVQAYRTRWLADGHELPDFDPAGVPVVSRPGLGDHVGRLLSSVGVTEDRYKAAKQAFGLPPTCSCAARREWLNKVSEWWKGQ